MLDNFTQVQRALPCTGCGSSCRVLSLWNGTLSDGSGPLDYANNARCQWIIAPTGSTVVSLTFAELSTQAGADFIRVYQCANTDCQGVQLIRELSGTYASVQTVTSGPGALLVQFTSDASTTSSGFTVTWTSNAPYSKLPNVRMICKSAFDQYCCILICF